MEYLAFNNVFLTVEHLYDRENLNNVENLNDLEYFYDVEAIRINGFNPQMM